MRAALSCVGAVVLALPLAAQTGSISRSVSVSVTNVDVVVTDAAGKPITDLTAADFEVRQDGKVQPITNFSFVRNPPPPPPPVREQGRTPEPAIAPRDSAPPAAARAHLIVFLDGLHLTAINRNRALTSLKEYLPTVVGPNVEVQLVTWDRSLRIRGPFLSDVPVLGRMLTEIGKEAALGNVPVREHMDLIRGIDQAFGTSDARMRQSLLDSAIISVKAWADEQAALLDSTAGAVRSRPEPPARAARSTTSPGCSGIASRRSRTSQLPRTSPVSRSSRSTRRGSASTIRFPRKRTPVSAEGSTAASPRST